ncbi:CBBY-like protein isoform X1 [Phragmites australis]|uniref:CBBY-like protein isoform X1 n=2 Tax=Phragmites australis TaxID=29695 RepID=UPI002D784C85|nr:CBBY-like protein isoform X1 [Phragmites australis]
MSAAAARCLLVPASPPATGSPETVKAPASIPTSCPDASVPVRAAVGPSSGRRIPASPLRCSSSAAAIPAAPELGVLLEVEGVLADVYRFGNRQAFNVAFQSLGLDCANWTEPIYADLVRKSRGDEEMMLVLFFDRIGWPTSLPTSEKGSFIKSALREKLKALEEFSTSDSLSLRPGVEKFIDDALSEGVPVAILATYGRNGEKMSRSIIEKLGPERTSKTKIVGKEEVEGSLFGQLVLGKGVASSLDEQLVREAQKAASAEKQRIAEEVASILKLTVDITASESSEKIIATLRAGSEYVGCDVQNCVLVAGSQSGVLAAERIGMPCVVVRSSFTARAEFHSAKAVMDGFGGTDLTISKLLNKKWS